MRTTSAKRQRLVAEHLSFVRSIAAKIRAELPAGVEFDELVSYGMQGLLEAADRFDGRHGAAFTTFAYYRVRGAIFDGLRGMGWLKRGDHARARFEEHASSYLESWAERRASRHGARISLDERVRQLAEALRGVAAVYLATASAQAEHEVGGGDEHPHHQLEGRERSGAVRQALATLPTKERRLLELYYYEDLSLGAAGRSLGLSKSWTSRLHARAIERLKQALERSSGGDAGGDARGAKATAATSTARKAAALRARDDKSRR